MAGDPHRHHVIEVWRSDDRVRQKQLGALAEHDFIYKLEKAGFTDVRVLDRQPVSIDDCALYPLFTDQVISLMRQLIPPQRHQTVAVSVVITASLTAPNLL